MRASAVILFCGTLFACQTEPQFTKDDYIQVAREIESTIKDGDPEYLNEIFDSQLLLKKVKRKESIYNIITKSSSGFVKGFMGSFKFGNTILSNLGNGYYDFLKYYEKEGTPHLVFRLFTPEGLNYHDFELAVHNGKIKLADCYIYLSGELLSKTLSDIMLTSSTTREVFGLPWMTDYDKDYLKSLLRIKRIRQHMQNNEYESARIVFDSIPENLRKEKLFLLTEIMVASNLEEDYYLNVIEKYQQQYPDDPSLDLIRIDALFLREQYDEIFVVLDGLQKEFGDDPVLDYYRGNLYFMKDSIHRAIEYFESLQDTFSDYKDLHLSLLNCYLETSNYPKVIAMADTLVEKHGYLKNELKLQFLFYPEFLESKEYLAWKERNDL